MWCIAGRQLTSRPFPASLVGNLLWISGFSIYPCQIIGESSEDRRLAPRQSKCVSYLVERYTLLQRYYSMTDANDRNKQLINTATTLSIARSVYWKQAQ